MCPTAYGLRGFALRLPLRPLPGEQVALCRQGCRAYGPAACGPSFTPAGSVGRSRSVRAAALSGVARVLAALRAAPPPPPLTALPLQQPDSQTAANRSKRPVAAFLELGDTSGRGWARKRAVGPFPGFLAVSAAGGSRARSGPAGWRGPQRSEDTGQPGQTLDATRAAPACASGGRTKGEARHPAPRPHGGECGEARRSRARGSAP